MVRGAHSRVGEGLAAAVRAEIEQLDLARVFSCVYDGRSRTLRLLLVREHIGREYPATPESLESIYGRLRAHARVRRELASKLAA